MEGELTVKKCLSKFRFCIFNNLLLYGGGGGGGGGGVVSA